MTRQRERSSLLHYYTEDCPSCAGLGKVPSPETMLVKLERAMRRVSAMGGVKRIVLRVSPEVALYFVEQEARRFSELEKRFRLQIDLKDDPALKRGEMRVLTLDKQDLTDKVVGAVPVRDRCLNKTVNGGGRAGVAVCHFMGTILRRFSWIRSFARRALALACTVESPVWKSNRRCLCDAMRGFVTAGLVFAMTGVSAMAGADSKKEDVSEANELLMKSTET
jgi:hypothetical protein